MIGSTQHNRWQLLSRDLELEDKLINTCRLPRLVARVLVSRGYTTQEQIERFLTASLERDWVNPLFIPGLAAVADRVQHALDSHERIVVFGDFDVDGICATALLTDALKTLGACVYPFIPSRVHEGYSLSKAAFDRLVAAYNPNLIITVDNGIDAHEQCLYSIQHGVDVVITDHHEPTSQTLPVVPTANPKLNPSCASFELAGAGVALKLVDVLGAAYGKPYLWKDYLDVATLGTISDRVKLTPENRALVTEGIRCIRASSRLGLSALARVCGIDIHATMPEELASSLIPRLNAAGRLDRVQTAYNLLQAQSLSEAYTYANELEELNICRRNLEKKACDEAFEQAKDAVKQQKHVIFVSSSQWNEGVIGIVASRLARAYELPAFACSIVQGSAKCSGRSVGNVNLFDVVERFGSQLIRFGGHAAAVGFTCSPDILPTIIQHVERTIDALPASALYAPRELVIPVDLSEITVSDLDSLEMLQPFGSGNERPIFAAHNIEMRNKMRVGAHNNHMRFVAQQHKVRLSSIVFKASHIQNLMSLHDTCDIVFNPVNEVWQGRVKPKLMIKDIIVRKQDTKHAHCDTCAFSRLSLPQRELDSELNHESLALRRELEQKTDDELENFLRTQLIGDHALLPVQAYALNMLRHNNNCLCVMATGRGKSLIFQLFACMCAIKRKGLSIFVYPLRALVNDQSYHISDVCSKFGVRVCVLNGETPQSKRLEIYQHIKDGTCDIVMTTPEFLALHAHEFAGTTAFVVFDEAHHMAEAKRGTRSAYSCMPQVLDVLGNPVTLAVSATVSTDCAREILRLAHIRAQHVILDDSQRSNLDIIDRRNANNRDEILVNLIADGEKTVVYVNSRIKALQLVHILRHRLPEFAPQIAFYHAGLSRDVRVQVQTAFRAGDLIAVIATSAFGEGVNISDIRRVVLYNMPFTAHDFNQMSGRAGRDHKPSEIYALYTKHDIASARYILSTTAPCADDLQCIYTALVQTARKGAASKVLPKDSHDEDATVATVTVLLKDVQDATTWCDISRSHGASCSSVACEKSDSECARTERTNEVLHARTQKEKGHAPAYSVSTIEAALQIFKELKLIDYNAHTLSQADVALQRVTLTFNHADIFDLSDTLSTIPVMLEKSIRYVEGLRMWEEFDQMSAWAHAATRAEMLARVQKPILPAFGNIVDERVAHE